MSDDRRPAAGNDDGQRPAFRRRTVLALPLGLAACSTRPGLARQAATNAQDVVRGRRLGPTDAARLYAYVTTVYRDVEAVAGPDVALAAARWTTDDLVGCLPASAFGFPATPVRPTLVRPGRPDLPRAARAVVDGYARRCRQDGRLTAAAPVAQPATSPHWTPPQGSRPTTPGAGCWQAWDLAAQVPVPAPPSPGTPADREECAAVRDAVARRTPEQERRIRFWRAAPGSVTPSGMWLDIAGAALATSDPGELPGSQAQALALVARTCADAARECWRVKYTYWTARPSVRMPGLDTANPDPPFPAYPSGHSAMSAAAATVLAALLPDRAEEFLAQAQEARDTRLRAGVHFPVDNVAGYALGQSVAEEALRQSPSVLGRRMAVGPTSRRPAAGDEGQGATPAPHLRDRYSSTDRRSASSRIRPKTMIS